MVSQNPAVTRQDNIVTTYADLPISPLQNVVKSALVSNVYTGVLNHRLGRYEVWFRDPTTGQQSLIAELPTPPGATCAVERPGTLEVWMAIPNSRIGDDPATGSPSPGGVVVVFDPIRGEPIRSIAVGLEPSGIAFHPSGSHAYVSCRGSRDVHVIDCFAGLSVAAVNLNQHTPHAIAFDAARDRLLVAALLSGNNTVAKGEFPGDPTPLFVVDATTDPQVTGQLPDRDVVALRVSPANPAAVTLAPAELATGVMTIQYAIEADPIRPRAYVVGTEALNDQFVGERNFPAGRVVENRLVVLDYGAGGTAPVAKTIDLDASPFAPMATPTDFVVAPSGRRAWLVARGVDRVVEFRLGAGAPVAVGAWELRSANPSYGATRVGARNATIDPTGTQLTVYCEIENSFAFVDVSGAAPTTTLIVNTTPLSYDPLPDFAKRGLAHLSDADRSASRTSSCFSCHVDGGQDNVVWELSKWHDPEGTAGSALTFEEDFKGPMLTQTLLGLPEVAPYHWRGEQRTLADFNGAFSGLLEGAELTPTELPDMVDAIGLLRHRPNRHLAMNRSYASTPAPAGVGNVAQGLVDFETFPVYAPAGTLSCASCHSLPTGTNNEIQFINVVGPPSFTVQVAQLRGVVERLDAPINLGPYVGNRCGNGAGLLHFGGVGSFQEFVVQPVFLGLQSPATQGTRDNLVAFMESFDTGLAPASSLVRVLRTDYANPAGDFANVMAYVQTEAAAGHADFSVIISIPNGTGGFTPFTGFWDNAQGAWISEIGGFPPTPPASLLSLFLASGEPLTIMGHPPGSGQRFTIDADDDGLIDSDEWPLYGTSPFVTDTDGDGRPDGHEVLRGDDPLVVDTSNDNLPPNVIGSPRLMFATTNTVKVELNTDEVARVRAFTTILTPAGPALFPLEGQQSPAAGGYAVNHQLVLHHLPAAWELPLLPLQLPTGPNTFQIDLEITDPAGNFQVVPFVVTMPDRSRPVRVQAIANPTYVAASNDVQFTIELMVGTTIVPLPLPAPIPGAPHPAYELQVEIAYGTQPGGPGTQILGLTKLTDPVSGTNVFRRQVASAPDPAQPTVPMTNPAVFTAPLPPSAPTASNRVVTVTVLGVTNPPAAAAPGYIYIETQAFTRHHAILPF
ncbi:MAG: hypothetical protein IPM29_10495 [Planctomycetes bacterium]|nr:hypothetical protein [Planctomycetota bacterium]